jgi:hypothetical protein
MTSIARECGVLAVKLVSGFGVIESFRIPAYHREIFAIVVGVAFDTRVAWRSRGNQCRVQPSPLLQSHGNLSMAIEAAKIWRA